MGSEPDHDIKDDRPAVDPTPGDADDRGAGGNVAGQSADLAAKVKRHWYQRVSIGARMFFWSIYFGIFVVAAVAGIVIALLQMAASPIHAMEQPVTSMIILVTGTIGEMWCLHRNLGIYMLGLPGKSFARWGVYISGGALSLSFLLALVIVVLYLKQ